MIGVNREETTTLLREARAGSQPALDELYRRHAPRLLAAIRLRMGPELRSQMESHDLLQACLLKSFERIDQFENGHEGSLMAWLGRIAENEIRDQVKYQRRGRRDARRNVALDQAATPLPENVRSALSRVILDERAGRLERALERLSPEHRGVILLRKIEERGWEDVGRIMGKSPDACRMLLARAMTRLTLEFGES